MSGTQKVKKAMPAGLKISTDVEAKEAWIKRAGGGRGDNTSHLIGRLPFRNTLPDPPMDPKFLNQPAELLQKQVAYKTNSLEARYKHPILTSAGLGITINLIDPYAYQAYDEDDAPKMHPTDVELSQHQVDPPGLKKKFVRPTPRVSWLRKTEYMSNELSEPAQKFKSQNETMAMYREQAKNKDTDATRSLEERLDDIEATFQLSKEPPVHPKKKNLKVKRVVPVVPDLGLWANQYTAISFDDEAAKGAHYTKEDAKKALIKAYRTAHEAGAQYIGYMLPKRRKLNELGEEEARAESEEGEEEGVSLYDWIRNYSFVNETNEGETNIILVESENSVELPYVLCESKLAVHRVAVRQTEYKPAKVCVKRREINTNERNKRGRRKREHLDQEFDTEPDSEHEEEMQEELPEPAEQGDAADADAAQSIEHAGGVDEATGNLEPATATDAMSDGEASA